mmetsp:Transcript_5457/g.15492  ORF Transcript_5457/g.15492 Transcript_5457/m.15492 type:complete len:212 (-) Transcript_5457:1027-1662(-)
MLSLLLHLDSGEADLASDLGVPLAGLLPGQRPDPGEDAYRALQVLDPVVDPLPYELALQQLLLAVPRAPRTSEGSTQAVPHLDQAPHVDPVGDRAVAHDGRPGRPHHLQELVHRPEPVERVEGLLVLRLLQPGLLRSLYGFSQAGSRGMCARLLHSSPRVHLDLLEPPLLVQSHLLHSLILLLHELHSSAVFVGGQTGQLGSIDGCLQVVN